MINLNEGSQTRKNSYFNFNNDIMNMRLSLDLYFFLSAEVFQAHVLTLVLNLEVNLGS